MSHAGRNGNSDDRCATKCSSSSDDARETATTLAEWETRTRALEDKLAAWSTRLQRLERSSPLEERIRDLEARLATFEATTPPEAIRESYRKRNRHGGKQHPNEATLAIPLSTFTFSVFSSFHDAFSGMLKLGRSYNGMITKTLKRWIFPLSAAWQGTRPILGTNADSSETPKIQPTDSCDNSNQPTFCLKPGMDGYSPSLDIASPVVEKDPSSTLSPREVRSRISILHKEAVKRQLDSYVDPATGYDVFSAHHLKTRDCCGSSCRHCPWGHKNVPGKKPKKVPKLEATKFETAKESSGENDSVKEEMMLQKSPLEASTSNRIPNSVAAKNQNGWVAPKSRLYTRKGDTGWGELYSGQTVPKFDPIYEAIGEVDELNSTIGLAIQLLSRRDGTPALSGPAMEEAAENELADRLESIQGWLLDLASTLCTPHTKHVRKLRKTRSSESSPSRVLALERWIDASDAQLVRLHNFVLPGGSPGASALHVARAVCRRAERRLWALVHHAKAKGANHESTTAVASLGVVLNRLSDFLFVAARLEAHAVGAGDLRYGIDRKHGDRWQRRILR